MLDLILHPIKYPPNINSHYLVKIIFRLVNKPTIFTANTRVVNPNVQTAVSVNRLPNGSLYLGRISHIAGNKQRLSSCTLNLLNCF